MKVEIRIPEIAEGVTAGTVVALSVALGEQVEVDQTLLELETDKAVVAIPTPVAGTISALQVAVGDVVSIGTVMALIEGASVEPSEVQEKRVSSQIDPVELPPDAVESKTVEPSSPVLLKVGGTEPVPEFNPLPGEQQVAAAAPSVRRLARELGVDIHRVAGSGPRGRIAAEDVNTYVKKTLQAVGSNPAANFSTQRPLPDFSRFGTFRREPLSRVRELTETRSEWFSCAHCEPLSRVRELTGEAMAYAWATIPMVTQFDKAVVGRVDEFRQAFNAGATAERKLTMTAFLVKVCAAALRTFPELNSVLDQARSELILLDYINICVAVDTSHGLLVP
ncbi:MAG: 2-oxo acid dehydrogenase subunit E2, partial [Geopsychrobacter sp.]|nr:2-oxo acid dehydrogenase subunit E2 [Geopsychrobacter sp.]